MADTFPRQNARTQRFTLGSPRDLRLATDGSRLTFLRSRGGEDPVTCLWLTEVGEPGERLVVDPRNLGEAGDVPPAERARRERAREAAAGIVAYDVDAALRQGVFALDGRLHHVDLVTGVAREVTCAAGVFDPRLDPTGSRVAYVSGPGLRVSELAVDEDRPLAEEPESPDVSWGSAEFVAAEELGRMRGFWWGPDGRRLLAARVDVAPVPTWYISSPIDPAAPPAPIRYPGAGETNAVVDLAIVSLDGVQVPVAWRRGEWEYLVSASWAPRDRITLLVLTRDQRTAGVIDVDPSSGEASELTRWSDPCWVDVVPGAPAWLDDRLLLVVDDAATDTRRLTIDGVFATPAGLQVRSISSAGMGGIVLEVSSDPTETHVMVLDAEGGLWPATRAAGVHRAWAASDTIVVASRTMEHDGVQMRINRQGIEVGVLTDHSAIPLVRPAVAFETVGSRQLRAGVLFPTNAAVDERFPVLLDPYGGPHHARVVRSRSAWLSSQWFADQGFAVVVIDNRGTPGRGPAFERGVHLDLAGPVIEDQVDALVALADRYPQLDLDRVAIRGWSFGGFLAALAVMRRPDIFKAAVAGAPVTDWRLYDTGYTERYLGHPDTEPEAYARSGLIADAANLTRPLMLIHGLADDNVVSAHTLALSQALLEAGRPHQVLPLSGVTHMASQESVAENLLLLQLAFLRDHV